MYRKSLSVLAVMFVTLSVIPIAVTDDYADGAVSGSLWISEVCPADEAVTLANIGSSTIKLDGFSITDGEGTLTFSSGCSLEAGGSITLSKTKGTDWFNSRSNVVLFTSTCITKSGSFILADSGDEVSLMKGSYLVDSVCYGKSEGVDGWTGEAAALSSKQYLKRISATDTDTAADWISTKPGWTNYSFDAEGYQATVTPFTFPESCGIPIFDAVSSACKSIDISIYLLTSQNLVALLCQMEENGVDVKVLIEGSPLGTDISTELSLMKSLTDSGGEVRIINYSGCSDPRYTYVHNKYAVIDSEKVIITSENWTSGNLGDYGNRGWGAVIDSGDYALYMEEVFENDYSLEWGDVRDLLSVYPNLKPYAGLSYSAPSGYSVESYESAVVPILSPDDSLTSLRSVIADAGERVYAEQMDLGSTMSSVTSDTPISWMSAKAAEGLDVKFILDASQTDAETHESYVSMIVSATGIEAVTVDGGDGFDLIHNKGLIVDDSVWVGSVNWTETSFSHNRESAVLIMSQEVSDYFAYYFLDDFGVNLFTVEDTGLNLSVSVADTVDGQKVLLKADGPAGCRYQWSLGDGTVRVSENPSVLFDSPGSGTYIASVILLDSGLEESLEYTVHEAVEGNGCGFVAICSGIAAAVVGLGLVSAVIRQRRERRRHRGRPRVRSGRERF